MTYGRLISFTRSSREVRSAYFGSQIGRYRVQPEISLFESTLLLRRVASQCLSSSMAGGSWLEASTYTTRPCDRWQIVANASSFQSHTDWHPKASIRPPQTTLTLQQSGWLNMEATSAGIRIALQWVETEQAGIWRLWSR